MPVGVDEDTMIVGVLGGGQLGRMMALAGLPLGLRLRFLDPDPGCPAAEAGELIVGRYDEPAALERFVRGVGVATYEFENVPAAAARWLTEHVAVFPPQNALAVAQDRVLEKRCFRSLGIGTAEFEEVDTLGGLEAAVDKLGTPCVLKTRRFGYDGKGQAVIRTPSDVRGAWDAVVGTRTGDADLELEAMVEFDRELSIIGVRGRDGRMAFYPAIENSHSGGILSFSVAPAPGLGEARQQELERACGRVMEHLDYVGVLTIEFFELAGGGLLANEMAPRVHNSGHWSIEGAECSQFENHLRAVCGLPLGSTRMAGSETDGPGGVSMMFNIVGRAPASREILAIPGARLHMYGKAERAGRKLGHVTLCADTFAGLQRRAAAVRSVLERAGGRP